MKKIYIVTTFTGTLLSCLIRNISKTPYAHVSIALNEYLRPMYSFGRLNPKTPIFAGFVEENINEGLYAIRTNTMCRVYSLMVTERQYEKLKENIDNVSINRKQYVYDVKALVYLSVNKPRKKDYKYVCSVALSMKAAGFYGLVLIDEFDNFSSIAKKGTVGQIRTLLSSPDYGVRAIVASRRMVERIEKEVEGAINSNVSILAAIGQQSRKR